MGYDAAKIESMDYDFSSFSWCPRDEAGQPLATSTGSVPEPSQARVIAWFESQRDISLEQQSNDDQLNKGALEMRRAAWAAEQAALPEDQRLPQMPADDDLPRLSADQLREYNEAHASEREAEVEALRERFLDALASICGGERADDGTWTGGQPSRAVLAALPYRQQQGFAGWLTGQFSPEALAAAISR